VRVKATGALERPIRRALLRQSTSEARSARVGFIRVNHLTSESMELPGEDVSEPRQCHHLHVRSSR